MASIGLPRRGLRSVSTAWSAHFRKPLVLNRARERSASSAAQLRETEDGQWDDVEARFPLYSPRPVEDTSEMEARMYSEYRNGKGNMDERLRRFEQETKELESKVLKTEKAQISEEYTADLPPYTEAQLEDFYRALLAAPLEPSTPLAVGSPEELRLLLEDADRSTLPALSFGERKEVVAGLVERLQRTSQSNPTLEGSSSEDVGRKIIGMPSSRTAGRHAVEILEALVPGNMLTPKVSLGIVSSSELGALFEDLIYERDLASASRTLDLSQRCGIQVQSQQVDRLLQAYSRAGQISEIQNFIDTHKLTASVPISYYQHLFASSLRTQPAESTITLLHDLESQKIFLPLSSYTSMIRRLLVPASSAPLSQNSKALAWNLYAHTRLVAHPTPSVELYTLMIRSCADPRDPQPERALDLFTEMREETGLAPDRDTFQAVILACARVKAFNAQAFRTLSEMLDLHQSALDAGIEVDMATGRRISGFEPTIEIFNALLEATKRVGDLRRARWILGEAVKAAKVGAVELNEDTLVGVLHTYASYKPVIARSDIVKAKGAKAVEAVETEFDMVESEDNPIAAQDSHLQLEDPPAQPDQPLVPSTQKEEVAMALEESSLSADLREADRALTDINSPYFTPPLGPQSAAEVIREADRLFTLILHDSTASTGVHPVFPRKIVTPRFINAYLSIHFAHSPFCVALARWESVWDEVGLQKNGWSYMFALEEAADVGTKSGRAKAVEKVKNLWSEWRSLQRKVMRWAAEGQVEQGWVHSMGYGAREVEKAWRAVIKIYTIADQRDKALDLVMEFRSQYPTEDILRTLPPPSTIPTPKIQLLSPLTVLEDDVPPHLLFHDLLPLHQRCVRDGDLKGVGLIKWATLGYQKALESRRARRLARVSYKQKRMGQKAIELRGGVGSHSVLPGTSGT